MIIVSKLEEKSVTTSATLTPDQLIKDQKKINDFYKTLSQKNSKVGTQEVQTFLEWLNPLLSQIKNSKTVHDPKLSEATKNLLGYVTNTFVPSFNQLNKGIQLYFNKQSGEVVVVPHEDASERASKRSRQGLQEDVVLPDFGKDAHGLKQISQKYVITPNIHNVTPVAKAAVYAVHRVIEHGLDDNMLGRALTKNGKIDPESDFIREAAHALKPYIKDLSKSLLVVEGDEDQHLGDVVKPVSFLQIPGTPGTPGTSTTPNDGDVVKPVSFLQIPGTPGTSTTPNDNGPIINDNIDFIILMALNQSFLAQSNGMRQVAVAIQQNTNDANTITAELANARNEQAAHAASSTGNAPNGHAQNALATNDSVRVSNYESQLSAMSSMDSIQQTDLQSLTSSYQQTQELTSAIIAQGGQIGSFIIQKIT